MASATRLLVNATALHSAAARSFSSSAARLAGGHGAADADSVAPQVPTGIEYAEESKRLGHTKQHKQDFKDYKCAEYLHYNRFSYYDVEVCDGSPALRGMGDGRPDSNGSLGLGCEVEGQESYSLGAGSRPWDLMGAGSRSRVGWELGA